jgi:hypothetical protein
VLVEERKLPAAAADRHVHQSAEAEAEQDATLHPGNRIPHAVLSTLRRTDLAALECREERFDDVTSVGGSGVSAGVSAIASTRAASSVSSPRETTGSQRPACWRAERTTASCRESSGTSGERRTDSKRPSMAESGFDRDGVGFDARGSHERQRALLQLAGAIGGRRCAPRERAPT